MRRTALGWLRSSATGAQASAQQVLAARQSPARFSVAVLAVTMASALSVAVLVPSASADSLTDRRDQVTEQLAQTRSSLNESTHALAAAGAAVDQAQAQLDAARAELARTQAELAAAQQRDVEMAARLEKAKKDLTAAKAAVVAGQKAVDAKIALAGSIIRDQYQQQTNLLPIALLLENSSTADLQTRLQWSTTMTDTTGKALAELKELQRKLEAKKARQAELERQVAADRLAAAANLEVKQTLEARAAAEESGVTVLVQQRQVAESAAAGDVARDKTQYVKLTEERASVEQRIATRIAQAKAEAAARKAAEQRAREVAARQAVARAAAEAKRAKQAARTPVRRSVAPKARASAPKARAAAPQVRRATPTRKSTTTATARRSATSASFGLPVSAPITSSYGNRLHPVLGYWKLHDGTDFGAGCGTAIRAPYAGRVAERYYNGGYGNRLMLDHGYVGGRYVTTGYNHATRYTVSVGQQVRKGQVIGYVGTTGYSTGCHLHLMVWLDGGLTNPMTWF